MEDSCDQRHFGATLVFGFNSSPALNIIDIYLSCKNRGNTHSSRDAVIVGFIMRLFFFL